MSAPARTTPTKKEAMERRGCDTDSGPSVMAIIFGVVGAAAAVGVGYLMGREIERCCIEDESEQKQSVRERPPPRQTRQPQSLPSAPPLPVEEKDALNAYETAILCKVCLNNAMDCVLLPCRHEVCCRDCTRRLDECPLCRTLIKDVITIYKG